MQQRRLNYFHYKWTEILAEFLYCGYNPELERVGWMAEWLGRKIEGIFLFFVFPSILSWKISSWKNFYSEHQFIYHLDSTLIFYYTCFITHLYIYHPIAPVIRLSKKNEFQKKLQTLVQQQAFEKYRGTIFSFKLFVLLHCNSLFLLAFSEALYTQRGLVRMLFLNNRNQESGWVPGVNRCTNWDKRSQT